MSTRDALLPIIRQMQDAGDDRGRALVLLACPDAVLLKYHPVFSACCARAAFAPGVDYVELRVAAMHAARDAHGLMPAGLARMLETCRVALSGFAAGAAG
ncbi:MAG: hypothetical protein ABJ354_20940, partial [Nitratireductor sp.]